MAVVLSKEDHLQELLLIAADVAEELGRPSLGRFLQWMGHRSYTRLSIMSSGYAGMSVASWRIGDVEAECQVVKPEENA